MSEKTLSDMPWFKFFGGKYLPFVKIASLDSSGAVFKAVCSYVCEDEDGIPDLNDPLAQALFQAIKQDIAASFCEYMKRVEGGKHGGRPPRKTSPNRTKPEVREEEGEVDVEKEGEEDGEERGRRRPPVAPAPAAGFEVPTVEEIRAYCKEQGLNRMDPAGFYDYYAARGWRTGSGPVVDWRAAARRWEAREKDDKPGNGERVRDYSEEWGI